MTLFSSHLSLSAGKDGGYREEGLLGLSPSISPSLDVRGGEGREGRFAYKTEMMVKKRRECRIRAHISKPHQWSAEATTPATATKTSLKKWICAASNFIALIPSRLIRQILELSSKGLYQSSGKKKDSSRPRQIVKLGISRRTRAVTAKKCIRNVIHLQSCCFANLNLLLFAVLVAVGVAVDIKLPNTFWRRAGSWQLKIRGWRQARTNCWANRRE